MLDRIQAEALFLEHLPFIGRAAAQVCSRSGVRGAEAEDFHSAVLMYMMEDDYALIRRYQGTANITTYLATIVTRRFADYERQARGRWRSSAASERLGPPAPELERLVYREGFSLGQAGEILRTSGRTVLSDVELARLLSMLPVREPLGVIQVPAEELLNRLTSTQDQETAANASETEEQSSAIERAIENLDPEERLIVQMCFVQGRSVADVARALGVQQKPLYRRLERLRMRLRGYLESGEIQDFRHPGILGPDGLPIVKEDLQASRIITDVTSANLKLLRLVQRDPASIYNLEPRQFEELVAELLSKQGYEISLTPPSKDGGFDMYAARKEGLGEFLYLVECKRYAPLRPVGVNIVRSLYGVVQKEQATAGVLVTTSRFTSGAEEFQQSVPHRLSLRDYLHLQQWLGPQLIYGPDDLPPGIVH